MDILFSANLVDVVLFFLPSDVPFWCLVDGTLDAQHSSVGSYHGWFRPSNTIGGIEKTSWNSCDLSLQLSCSGVACTISFDTSNTFVVVYSRQFVD